MGQLPGAPLACGFIVGPPILAAVKLAATLGALFENGATTFRAGHTGNRNRFGIATLGPAAAADKLAKAPMSDEERLSALRAEFTRGLRLEFDAWHFGLGDIQFLGKGIVKLVEHRYPGLFAGGNLIQLFFHTGRKIHVDIVGKELDQEIVDGEAQLGRMQAFFYALDIPAL